MSKPLDDAEKDYKLALEFQAANRRLNDALSTTPAPQSMESRWEEMAKEVHRMGVLQGNMQQRIAQAFAQVAAEAREAALEEAADVVWSNR